MKKLNVKKLLALLLTVCLLVGALPMSASADLANAEDDVTRVDACVELVGYYETLKQEEIEISDPPPTFSDVDELSDEEKTAIAKAVSVGIMAGTSANTFMPNALLTRAQGAVVAYRMLLSLNVPIPAGTKLPPDVSSGNWYSESIKDLCSVGIIDPSNRFSPDSVMVNGAFFEILNRCRSYFLGWFGVPTTVTLHYQDDGATEDRTLQPTVYKSNGLYDLTLPTAERNGYALVGWNTEEDGSGAFFMPDNTYRYCYDSFGLYKDGDYDYHTGLVYRYRENVTDLYARWQQIDTSDYIVYWDGDADELGARFEVVEIANRAEALLKTRDELHFQYAEKQIYNWRWGEVNTGVNSGRGSMGIPGTNVADAKHVRAEWGDRMVLVHHEDDEGEFVSRIVLNDEQDRRFLFPNSYTPRGKVSLGFNTKEDGSGKWYAPLTRSTAIEEEELYEQYADAPAGGYMVFHDYYRGAAPSDSFEKCPTHVVAKENGGYTCPEMDYANVPGFHCPLGWSFETANRNDGSYNDMWMLGQLVATDGTTKVNTEKSLLAYAPGTKLTWPASGTEMYMAYSMLYGSGGQMTPRIGLHPNGGKFAYGGETYWISNSLSPSEGIAGGADPIALNYDGNTKITVGYGNSGNTTKLIASAPTGKTFDCWNTKADGSGTSYAPGELVDPQGQLLRLYAQWKDKPASSGGGDPAPAEPAPETPETPEEETPETKTETAADGTVTTTATWSDGKEAVSVTTPEGDTTITVTAAGGEKMAEVKLPSEPGEAKEFEDVKEGSWYKESVDAATGLGLFSGTSEKDFEPEGELNRGMLVTVLHRLSGEVEYGVGKNVFDDVDPNKWYADAVDWASAVGVTQGKGSGFAPEDTITREQLVTMLYRYVKIIGADSKGGTPLTKFPDRAKVSTYAQDAMEWAVGIGLIKGRDNALAPQGTATRAEVAAVLVRLVDHLK